ncbi:MAG: RDD family protein [Verrucomicrobiales bacterium]|nr:RDD family protein [Verrucomicrobiales bacterium]
MKQQVLQIRTPEGLVFSQALAGPGARFLAWLVDCVVVFAAMMVLSSLAGLLGWISPELAQAFTVIGLFVINIGYRIGSEWVWRGQTVGKRLLRLRVVDAEGLRLSLGQVVLRNLLRFVDVLPAGYLVGGITALSNPLNQRLGDLAAGTVVIRIPVLLEPDIDQLLSGKFNSFRKYPHLVGRLRQKVSAPEAALALQAILRREDLAPEARVEVFHQIANYFRSILPFPPEVSESLPDEQYLRNVIDVLYRSQSQPGSSRREAADPLL